MKVRSTLEQHFKDMQDLEFTVEENRLYILQTRNGKRTGHAAVRIAVDMVGEKLITKKDAVRRVPADSLSHLLAPVFDREAVRNAKKIGTGLAAGPGAACGHVVFSAEEAVARADRGEKVVLARIETSPEDLRGMIAAEGILTSRGGVSSHAALVARQMGKVCVCGATGIQIDYHKGTLSANGTTLNRGDYISIDGTAGEVFAGEVATAPSEIIQVLVDGSLDPKKSVTYQEYAKLMKWADEFRSLGVRANADTPEQVKNAVAFGAEGIGLCRTEHMFFEGDRIDAMREMILAGTKDERARALAKLLPYQRGDFIGIFTALNGLPATIRFLDPPLHEFLPADHAQQNELANKLGVPVEQISRRVHELHEFNPMLGHRGCRLGITFPEISEMQARAIFEAAAEVQAKGIKVRPEIMIPLVGFPRELKLQIDIVRRVADEVAKETRNKIQVFGRDDDRDPARRAASRPDRARRRVLQLRHERSDTDHTGNESRRLGQFPSRVRGTRHRRFKSIRNNRSEGCWTFDGNYSRPRPQNAAGHQTGNLRRARRRTKQRQILSPARSRVRQLQPFPNSDRTISRGASSARELKRVSRSVVSSDANARTNFRR